MEDDIYVCLIFWQDTVFLTVKFESMEEAIQYGRDQFNSSISSTGFIVLQIPRESINKECYVCVVQYETGTTAKYPMITLEGAIEKGAYLMKENQNIVSFKVMRVRY